MEWMGSEDAGKAEEDEEEEEAVDGDGFVLANRSMSCGGTAPAGGFRGCSSSSYSTPLLLSW